MMTTEPAADMVMGMTGTDMTTVMTVMLTTVAVTSTMPVGLHFLGSKVFVGYSDLQSAVSFLEWGYVIS